MHDIARRVYDTDGASPTLHTCGGGNLEPKILVKPIPICLNSKVKRKDHIEVGKQIRVRKLTPRECGRLMGVKDEDIDKLTKNLSKSAQYHCFGDSIVVTILCAIFGEMLDVDWKAKVEELTTELSSPCKQVEMLSTRGKDTAGALRASMHKQGKRNLVENIEHGLCREGVIEIDNPIIIDDTYGYENEPRVYKENCPTLRADRQGLKVIEGQIGATETHIKNKERTK